MSIRNTLFTTAFALASLGAARADGLRPIEAQSIDLGDVSGVATTPSSVMGFMSSRHLRRASRELRSASYLFLHRARMWFSRHRTRQACSKSAGRATA
jgi:hypothetical protein